MEKERKFIGPASETKQLIDKSEGDRLTQWYLSPADSEHELRVRQKVGKNGTSYKATLKTGHGLERGETEVDITEAAAEVLKRSAVARISKTRHELDRPGLTLDSYHAGSMRFYSMIELEQQDDEPDIMAFTPESLGINGLIEVTGARYASNRHIATELPALTLPETRSTEDIIDQLEQLLEASDYPVIAAFSGPSASGKSTVMEAIQRYFGDKAATISTDDYYIGKTRMAAELPAEHTGNFDHPDAIDTRELARHLQTLRAGAPILRPSYSMKTGERTGELVEIPPTQLVLVEGIVANHPALANQIDLRSMIHANPATRLFRRMQRDLERTGWTTEEIMSYVMNTSEPAYIEHHQPNDLTADYCISTDS